MIITDRLTIEKMAVDMFVYPQKTGWHFDLNDLRAIRRQGRFSFAYSEMLDDISPETIEKQLEAISQIAPADIQAWLFYYVMHPSFKIDEKAYRFMLFRHWGIEYFPIEYRFSSAIILSDNIPETQVQINALFTTLKEVNAEEDEYITQQVEQYAVSI